MSVDKKFRVIIVGAGPVGLYMAHAMERANIDYIVLEQHTTVLNPSGQLLFTWPQTVRLLDQLGLYQETKEVIMPMHFKKRVYGHDGHVTSVNRFWDCMEENHGYPFLPILRADIIKVLYNNLPGKDTYIRTSAEVVGIETYAEGVHVHLLDGSVVDGSLVIGADGVHSQTRKLMNKLVLLQAQQQKQQEPAAEAPMVASFHGIFGRAYISDLDIEPEVFFESRGSGAVIQCLATRERVQFVTLKPLPAPAAARTRYTREQMEAYAESIADVAVCPGVRFRDVWVRADRTTVRMLNQEEGFVRRWHHGGRIVLVGDAVHKSTSINGLGMTCGLHSAAMLANLLQQTVTAAGKHSPSAEVLDQVLGRYQRERETEVRPIWKAGHAMVREVTQTSWMAWFWDKYILPWIDTESLARGLIPSVMLIRYGQILSYVPFPGKQGRVPWLRRPIESS